MPACTLLLSWNADANLAAFLSLSVSNVNSFSKSFSVEQGAEICPPQKPGCGTISPPLPLVIGCSPLSSPSSSEWGNIFVSSSKEALAFITLPSLISGRDASLHSRPFSAAGTMSAFFSMLCCCSAQTSVSYGALRGDDSVLSRLFISTS